MISYWVCPPFFRGQIRAVVVVAVVVVVVVAVELTVKAWS